MPRDNNGEYTRVHDWTADADANIGLSPERFDEDFDDIAAALSNTLVRDGSLAATGDLNMGTNRITNLAGATDANDAMSRAASDSRYMRAGIATSSNVLNNSNVSGGVGTVTSALNALKTSVDAATVTADAAAPATHNHDDLYYRQGTVNSLLAAKVNSSLLFAVGDLIGRNSDGPVRIAGGSNTQLLTRNTSAPSGISWVDRSAIYELPKATATVLGGVKVAADSGLSVNGAGFLSLAATQTSIVAIKRGNYASFASITGVIPLDDTTPLSTEGVEILSVAHTPADSGNGIRVRFGGSGTSTTGTWCAAIFDGGSAPLIAGWASDTMFLEHFYLPATTSPITFSVRVGPSAAGNMRMNGSATDRYLGGASRAWLFIEELG